MARYSFGIPPTASLILASALWAVATVISKKLLASVSPITFLIIQLAPSVSVLWILVLAKGVRPVKWRALLPLVALGWLNPGLSYTLSMLGLTRTTASVATLLWAARDIRPDVLRSGFLVLFESASFRPRERRGRISQSHSPIRHRNCPRLPWRAADPEPVDRRHHHPSLGVRPLDLERSS